MANSKAYYIWCDESEKQGEFYSNFYGGILIRSTDYRKVMSTITSTFESLSITQEVKWQKVSEYHLESYKQIVDMLFSLLEKDLIKIRIFFRHNKNVSLASLGQVSKHDEYLKLYYQFIKHSFGLQHSNESNRKIDVHLFLDDIPMDGEEKERFKQFIVGLSHDEEFEKAKIVFKRENIAEVDSKKHLPLQVMDLILGSMDFRLNNKHKVKIPGSRFRGKRTIAKEKLYKYINQHICQLRPNFNIGVSTSYKNDKEKWTLPYRHWSFVPAFSIVDVTKTKHYNIQDK